ncbi:uncharacterized protein [Oscarella lobularis]|uniref:uncharacterized protein isoform X2 n=1 Tax=Oscarella lobularis TaxID=121494 RepID=UPI003313A74B
MTWLHKSCRRNETALKRSYSLFQSKAAEHEIRLRSEVTYHQERGLRGESALRDALLNAQEIISVLISERDSLKEMYKSSQSEVSALKSELASAERKISVLNSKNASHLLEISELQKELLSLRDTMIPLHFIERKVEKRRRKFNFMRGRGQAEATDHPTSVYEANWNVFARIVSETCFTKLQDLGDCLKRDWAKLKDLSQKE